MKKALIIIAAIASIAVIGVAGKVFFDASPDATASSRTVSAEFSVERLTCGSCVENIRQALLQVEGVVSVETDVAKGKSLVAFDPAKTDAALIAKVMTQSGYPAQLYARENTQGVMTTAVDTTLYIARIGERLVPRADFNELIEQQRLAGTESGDALPVQYLVRFAWMTILQRELLVSAATEAGVTVANAELDAYISTNQLASADREKVRTNLLLERFFKQQNVDRASNPDAFASLLTSLQKSTPVQIFDESLKQSLSVGTKNSGGCGGGCCG
jgi:copper chaperone CopZ